MKTFNELLEESEVPVLVDFYADWCYPCQLMAPELENVSGRMGDKLKIVKVNVDKNPAVYGKYGFKGIPTLILFDKGNIVWRTSGYLPANQLVQQISPYLG